MEIHAEHITESLRLHGVAIFKLFSEDFLQKLQEDIAKNQLTKAADVVGKRKVSQDFFEATLNRNSSDIVDCAAIQIEGIVNNILGSDQTVMPTKISFNEIRYQLYLKDSNGIPWHRDPKTFRYVVAIVLLKGKSCFYSMNEFQEEQFIPLFPGWCLLLQMPGLFDAAHQQVHCVKEITEERATIGFRCGSFSLPS